SRPFRQMVPVPFSPARSFSEGPGSAAVHTLRRGLRACHPPRSNPQFLASQGGCKLPPAVYPKSHAGNSLRIQTESDDLGLCLVADDPGHLFQVSPFLERAKPRSGGPVVLIARTAVDLSGSGPRIAKERPRPG